jgi:kynureninase
METKPFAFDLGWAQQADQQDGLRAFRDQFYFPQHNGKDMLYFTGNSLGLQPKGVRSFIEQELQDWAQHGVEGHFQAKNPWFSYHEAFAPLIAPIVGAKEKEVVVMNQLTVNLHLLLTSFYRPSGKRKKILFEHKPFPSDHYAFESQARVHGLDPEEVLVEMQPREGEILLRTEDIVAKINELGDELATVCIGAVNYYTGQWFDMKTITSAAHAVGATCGFDMAHAAGNVPVQLHDWDVDFACWCSYKYLNSSPGGVSGIFVHERHHTNKDLVRLAGWWGHNAATRFLMQPGFDPTESAEAWQLSNAPVLMMAAHRASLELFAQTSMQDLRNKSMRLTAYLEFVLNTVAEKTGQAMELITPKDPEQRGCQISMRLKGRDKSLVTALAAQGVVVDWREPDTIRLAPVPLYNSFEDVYRLGEVLVALLG